MKILPLRNSVWIIGLVLGVPILAGIISVIAANTRNANRKEKVEETARTLRAIEGDLETFAKNCPPLISQDEFDKFLRGEDPCAMDLRNRGEVFRVISQMKEVRDGWGRPFYFEGGEFNAIVRSLGEDGEAGGDAADADQLFEINWRSEFPEGAVCVEGEDGCSG